MVWTQQTTRVGFMIGRFHPRMRLGTISVRTPLHTSDYSESLVSSARCPKSSGNENPIVRSINGLRIL